MQWSLNPLEFSLLPILQVRYGWDLKGGAEELISLHTQIEKSFGKITAKNPELTFTPHITIAKIPQKFVKIDVLPFLNTVYSPIELYINSICLFESQLFQEGAKYRLLNEFPLNR